MNEKQASGKYSFIVTEKNGETVVQIPDLSIIEKGKDFEEAYQKAKEAQDRVLEKYRSNGQPPPPARSVTLPVFAYKFVFAAMIIALTTAVITTINVTVGNYGKYSPKTILNEVQILRKKELPTLKFSLMDSMETLRLQNQGFENIALGKPATQSSYATGFPKSSGGVDGVKNGKAGFYTKEEDQPWWEVDLEALHSIREIKVYNRMCCKEDVIPLSVLISEDHEIWRSAYLAQEMFGGIDGNPLKISLDRVSTRWVRLKLEKRGEMYLDEVEVYGKPVSKLTKNGAQKQNESLAKK